MRKLTKHERHVLYCLMAELIRSSDVSFNCGFCIFLDYDFLVPFDAYNSMEFKKYLPELYSKRPATCSFTTHWFICNRRGWDKRLELVEQCILETN